MTVHRIIVWETWGPPDLRWAACENGREEAGAHAFGPTPETAIADLKEILDLGEDDVVEIAQ